MKNYLREKLKSPYVYSLLYIAIMAFYGYFRLNRGDSVDFVMMKLCGILLLVVSTFCFVRLYEPELIKRNVSLHINAFSAMYGLIFTAGFFIFTWKPNRFDTGDLYACIFMFISFSLLQRYATKRKCEEFAARDAT